MWNINLICGCLCGFFYQQPFLIVDCCPCLLYRHNLFLECKKKKKESEITTGTVDKGQPGQGVWRRRTSQPGFSPPCWIWDLIIQALQWGQIIQQMKPSFPGSKLIEWQLFFVEKLTSLQVWHTWDRYRCRLGCSKERANSYHWKCQWNVFKEVQSTDWPLEVSLSRVSERERQRERSVVEEQELSDRGTEESKFTSSCLEIYSIYSDTVRYMTLWDENIILCWRFAAPEART